MLVVDDEQVIRFAFQSYFDCHGFAVDVASTLEEAMAALTKRDYDVLIADLRLGGTDGTEGLDVIRAARLRSKRMVILLLTAYRTAAVDRNGLAGGADVLLQKPQALPDVAHTLKALLAQRGLSD